jgi:hypothetical protein
MAILNRFIVLPLWLLSINNQWVSMAYEYIVVLAVVTVDYILLRKSFRSYTIIRKVLYVIGIILLNYIFNFIFSFLASGNYGLEVVYDTSIISQALIILILIYLLSGVWMQIKKHIK